ncbi:unnamed protein product [Discosporangium mesarthrocarpum]
MAHIVRGPAAHRAISITRRCRSLTPLVRRQTCRAKGERSRATPLLSARLPQSSLGRWDVAGVAVSRGRYLSTKPDDNSLQESLPGEADVEHIFEEDEDPGPPPPMPEDVVSEPSEKIRRLVDEITQLNMLEMSQLITVYKVVLACWSGLRK